MHKAKLFARGQKVPIEQQKVVEAKVMWNIPCRYKESKALRQGRKYEMLYWDNKASLVVKDTEPSDNATYKCVLSNQFGSAEADATLTVHSKFKDQS